MPDFEMKTSTKLDTFLCKKCDQEFAVVMVMRPSESYASENPYCEPTWSYFSNHAAPPFCPFCGNKIIAEF